MKSSIFSMIAISHAFPLKKTAVWLWGFLVAFLIFGIWINLFESSPIKAQISTEEPIDLLEIDSGRSRIFVPNFAGKKLQIRFQNCQQARFLMIRKGGDLHRPSISRFFVSLDDGPKIEISGESDTFSKRFFIPLPEPKDAFTIHIESLDQKGSLLIDEIGLFAKIPKTFLTKLQYKLLFMAIVAIFTALGFWSLSNLEQKALFGAIFCFFLALFIHSSILAVSCSSDYNRDFKTAFAAGPLQEAPGANLNYGLHMASSVLQGKGPLIKDMPPWCRMPGYGYLLALAGHSSDLLKMALNALLLQSLLFAFSLAFFFWASIKIMPLAASFLTSLIASFIAYSPPQGYYLQIESIIPALILLFLGAVCLFYDQKIKNHPIPFLYHFLLHGSLGLWFFMRTDILPAWVAISLILYARKISTWKYFILPASFIICIALPWAYFKMPYSHEFSMTTNSIGVSMMAGMWEIPHDFAWTPTDGSYYSWMEELGLSPISKRASDFAVSEVLRFWMTYPFYMLSLWFHKFLLFASHSDSISLGTNWWRFGLLMVIFLAFVIKHKREQTFWLSTLVFFNIPVFFQFFSSSGRFYFAPSICLFAAALPLLFDREFYRKLAAHRKITASIAIFSLLFIFFAPKIDDFFINCKSIRYNSPFLDPNKSTLNHRLPKNSMKPQSVNSLLKSAIGS